MGLPGPFIHLHTHFFSFFFLELLKRWHLCSFGHEAHFNAFHTILPSKWYILNLFIPLCCNLHLTSFMVSILFILATGTVLFFFPYVTACYRWHFSFPSRQINKNKEMQNIYHACPSQFRKEYSVLRYSQPFIPKITPINNWMYPSSDCLFWPTKLTFY